MQLRRFDDHAVAARLRRGEFGTAIKNAVSNCAAASLLLCASLAHGADPITIQAENYAQMNGVGLENTTDVGGGRNVGWINAGSWLSYAPVTLPCAGAYTLEVRVASKGGGGRFAFEKAGGSVNYATVNVPDTGDWQRWTTLSQTVTLPAGSLAFGIAAQQGGWNINWFRVTPQCGGSQNPKLSAKVAAAEMGKGFNLGQMFDATQHPPTYAAAKAKIDAYYAQGFRNVRIPITWTEATNGSSLVNSATVGDVKRDHPRLAVIKQVVDYALSLPGMYVVINAHHEHALKDNNRWWVLERLWADIADIFRDRSHKLVFEVLNEPHLSDGSAMAPANLRSMTSRAYAKIRAVDPARIVVIGGNQWFGAHEMAQTWNDLNGVGNGSDPYVMATFHHYHPWTFNGDNQGDYSDNWTDYDMYSPMDKMAEWANSVGRGMPVFIGEWGTGWGSRYPTMNCNNIRMWYQKFDAQYAKPKNQPTAVWDDGGWFKVFEHGSNRFANNLAQCISGKCDWDTSNRFNSACY